MKIFAELKRRNVFKVASVYVITCWLILQIVSVIAPALHLPVLFSTILTVILAIGLPIACIFAWAFELTPEGFKYTNEVELEESIRHETGSKINRLLLIALILAIAFIAYDKLIDTPVSDNEKLAIAVLPFEDMSPMQTQAYFGEGMAEEIINSLTRLEQLMVISRLSSFSFKNSSEDIRQIGEALDVNYVLKGSVRKDKDNLRITAQLIRVSDATHIWSQKYDRKLDNVFEVQDELTFAITQALKLNLLPEELNFQEGMTDNPHAYDAFIQARELGYERTPQSLQQASKLLEQAIDIDPDFFLAKAQQYVVYELGADYGGFSTEEQQKQQERLFWELLSSPDFALKHLVQGLHASKHYKQVAKTLFEQAYQKAPNDTYIQNLHLLNILDVTKAIAAREEVLLNNPENEVNYSNLIYLYDYNDQHKQANALRRELNRKFPQSLSKARSDLFLLYSKQQDIAQTLAYLETNDQQETQYFMRFDIAANVVGGKLDVALNKLQEAIAASPDSANIYYDSLVLLFELHLRGELTEPQSRQLLDLPMVDETQREVAALLGLFKGDELAFEKLHGLDGLGPEVFMQKMQSHGIAKVLYAAIKKHSGDGSYAKRLSEEYAFEISYCKQTQGRHTWCPLYLYIDDTFSEQEQFYAFNNSLLLLNELFVGEEIFILQSPVYYGVASHPEFNRVSAKFLRQSYEKWAPSLWQGTP